MPWWTSREINSWERARRAVDLHVELSDGACRVQVRSGAALSRAAILLAFSGETEVEGLDLEGPGSLSVVERHGRRFLELAVDLEPGEHTWVLTGPVTEDERGHDAES